jgi:hypothetical protein
MKHEKWTDGGDTISLSCAPSVHSGLAHASSHSHEEDFLTVEFGDLFVSLWGHVVA